jgi:uncharacterized BrkB/YihY/UPF0761 family membrane protein
VSAGPVASPLSSRRARLREFWSRAYQKSVEDNIFFMAGAISYNLLVAVVPLVLLAVGLWGYVLATRFGEPSEAMVGLPQNYIPAMGGEIDLLAEIKSRINGLVASRAGYLIVGFSLFPWLSTRLVSTLRIAPREVFDIAADRGVVRGKIFDLQVAVLGGVLVLSTVVITVGLQSVGGWGTEFLGIPEGLFGSTARALATLLAFMSTWALFALVYWYVPRPADQLVNGMGSHDGHDRIVRVDEMGVRLVRDVRSRLRLRVRKSRHRSRALVLDLLRVGSVCPQRPRRPGLHHTKGTQGADSNCFRGLGVTLEDC